MKSSTRKQPKEPGEDYPTPYPLAQAIVDRVWNRVPRNIKLFLEPSCGSGNFVKAIRERYGRQPFIEAVDPHLRHEAQVRNAGASKFYNSTFELWAENNQPYEEPRIIIGNPPFSLAQKHIEIALNVFPEGSWIIFLLRLGFLSGLERTKTFWDYRGLPYLEWIAPITPRPSFVRGTNDNSEYGLFAWRIFSSESGNRIESAIIWKK